MSNLAIITKPSFIPAKFYELTDSNLQPAVEKVSIVNSTLETDADKRRYLLTYIEANTDKLKTWQYNPETGYISDLLTLLETVIGFRINKFAGYEIALYAQIRCALESVGETYPQIGRLEIFSAIKYALKYKPEILKSYDTKDDISTFTGLYLCTIVKYYLDEYRNNAMRKVDEMFSQVTFIKNIEENNLYKIQIYRNGIVMVLQNIGNYLIKKDFLLPFDVIDYGKHLYKNMQLIGFLKESNFYADIWGKWKNREDLTMERRKLGCQRQIIVSEIEKYRELSSEDYTNHVLSWIFNYSEYVGKEYFRYLTGPKKGLKEFTSHITKSRLKRLIPTQSQIIEDAKNGCKFSFKKPLLGLALRFGFFGEIDIKNIDLTKDMSIEDILAKYGKNIINIYPLQYYEMMVRTEDYESVFSFKNTSNAIQG